MFRVRKPTKEQNLTSWYLAATVEASHHKSTQQLTAPVSTSASDMFKFLFEATKKNGVSGRSEWFVRWQKELFCKRLQYDLKMTKMPALFVASNFSRHVAKTWCHHPKNIPRSCSKYHLWQTCFALIKRRDTSWWIFYPFTISHMKPYFLKICVSYKRRPASSLYKSRALLLLCWSAVPCGQTAARECKTWCLRMKNVARLARSHLKVMTASTVRFRTTCMPNLRVRTYLLHQSILITDIK